MIRILVIISILVICMLHCNAQKPVIDGYAYKSWPLAKDGAISNDGQYALFISKNIPTGSCSLVIKATMSHWNIEFPGVCSGEFSSDSKYAIFLTKSDSLCIASLGTSRLIYLPGILDYKLSTD